MVQDNEVSGGFRVQQSRLDSHASLYMLSHDASALVTVRYIAQKSPPPSCPRSPPPAQGELASHVARCPSGSRMFCIRFVSNQHYWPSPSCTQSLTKRKPGTELLGLRKLQSLRWSSKPRESERKLSRS